MNSLRHFIFALLFAVVMLNGVSCSKGAKVASLAISPYNGSTMANGMTHIANGTTQLLIATATLTDGSTFNFSSVVEWSSSNPNIYVDNVLSKGTVSTATALDSQATDTTTITAIDTVNHVSASIIVVVTTPQSITITPANPHMHFGAIHQFLAEASFDVATQAVTTQDVTSFSSWTVSPIGYANVTNALIPGLVGGGIVSIPAGTVAFTQADIEATFSSLPIGSTPLIITGVPIASVTVTPTLPSIIISSGTTTLQFSAIGNYLISGVTSTLDFTSSVTWLSSNTAVATIDSTGLATSASTTITGSTTITAIDPITNLYGQVTLNVTP